MESSTQKMYNQLWFPGKATISNDGATILKLLDVVHPAAKTLVDIARSQDAEVRSVCVWCCFFAFWTGRNTGDNLHCQNIITGFPKYFFPSSGRGRHHLRHSPGRWVPEAAEVVRGGRSPPSDHHQSIPHRHQPCCQQDQGRRCLGEERRQAVSAHCNNFACAI